MLLNRLNEWIVVTFFSRLGDFSNQAFLLLRVEIAGAFVDVFSRLFVSEHFFRLRVFLRFVHIVPDEPSIYCLLGIVFFDSGFLFLKEGVTIEHKTRFC